MKETGTTYEYVLQGDYGYGHGWEDIVTESTKEGAKERKREYQENAGQYLYRIVKRREDNE